MRRHRYVLAGLLVLGALGCKKPGAGKPDGTEAPKSAAATDTAAPTVATAPTANRVNAKALNVQGMKAYKTKDYPGAAEKFRAAIAADASFALPRYNLACVAALTNDKATARAQLEWLATSSDPQARRTLIKAGSDPDLKSLADDAQAQKILQWSGVFPGYRALLLDESASAADEKRLTKATDEPNDECEAAFKVARSIKGELAADHPGLETLVVSLAQGAVLFDAAGKVIAKGVALDPDCAGGSQAGLTHISAGQVVPDDEPELLIYSSGGGHGDGYNETVAVLKRRGDKLEILITAFVQPDSKGEFSLDAVGTIRHRESGEKETMLKRWDAAKFALVASPAPAPPAAAAKPAEGGGQGPSAKVEGDIEKVYGFTTDGNFFEYDTQLSLDDEGDGPRLLVSFSVIRDMRTGLSQSYVNATDGEMKKAEKKEYAKYPNLAAYKAWSKEHPTKCIGGRTSPDGKSTASIKQTGKKMRGSWRKDKYHFTSTGDGEIDDHDINLEMMINRDGKVISTNAWAYALSGPEGELDGDVLLCWSQDSQHVVWIIKRGRAMMRDPGGTYIEIAKSAAAAPAK